jgi:hypothetical protein
VNASIVLAGGVVISYDQTGRTAESVAIRDNHIQMLGTLDEARAISGPDTRWIDCRNRVILPGFHDAHLHISSCISRKMSLDLGPEHVKSIEDIKHQVSRSAGFKPRGEWVLGSGYDEYYLSENRHPNRHDLDLAAPEHPVRLSHRSGHACVLNSKALLLAGIKSDMEEPDGVVIDRDPETGEPNGILLGRSGWWEAGLVPELNGKDDTVASQRLGDELSSFGITTIQDAGADNGIKEWRRLASMVETGALKCRVTMMPGLSQFEQGFNKAPAPLVRLGPIKVMIDENRGYLNPSLEVLIDKTSGPYQAGMPLAIHAVEGSQLDRSIRLLETLKSMCGPAKAINRIEHCSVAPPEVLLRLKAIGAAVVTHPAFIYFHGDRYLSTVNSRDLPWLYATNGMNSAGLTVAAASDGPMAPPDPMRAVVAAVTRRTRKGMYLGREQAVSMGTAIGFCTINSARVEGIESSSGSIEPGKDADLVVLSRDPRICPLDELEELRVLLTLARGRIIYDPGAL